MTTFIRKVLIISKIKLFNIFRSPQLLSTSIMSIGFCYILSEYVPEEQLLVQPLYITNMGLLFSIAMGGIMMIALPLAADKENNILRLMMVSTISPLQYLLGSILPTFLVIFFTNSIIGYFWLPEAIPLGLFLIVTSLGTIISMTIGLTVGFYSSNQMTASSTCIPVIFIFAFIPILSTISKDFEKYSQYIYTSQILDYLLNLNNKATEPISLKMSMVIACTLGLSLASSFLGYHKNRFDK